jgi:hypothetical protein
MSGLERALLFIAKSFSENHTMKHSLNKDDGPLTARQRWAGLYHDIADRKRRDAVAKRDLDTRRKYGRLAARAGGAAVLVTIVFLVIQAPLARAVTGIRRQAMERIEGPPLASVKLPGAVPPPPAVSGPRPEEVTQDAGAAAAIRQLSTFLGPSGTYDFNAAHLWKADLENGGQALGAARLRQLSGKPFAVTEIERNRHLDGYHIYCDFPGVGEYVITLVKGGPGLVFYAVDTANQ